MLSAAAELSRFSFSLAYPRPQQLGAVRLRRPYSHGSWTPSFLLAQKSAQQIKWLDYNQNLTAIKRLEDKISPLNQEGMKGPLSFLAAIH